MTELDDFIREVHLRAVTEDPDSAPPTYAPVTLAEELMTTPSQVLGRAFRRALRDREAPLATTQEVKHSLTLAEPDLTFLTRAGWVKVRN